MPITANQVVSIAYTLRDDEGEILDQSAVENPLVYLHGHKNLIPGMEEALDGKDAGDQIETVIPPEKAYGAHDPELDLAIGLDQFPPEHHDQLEPGVQFQGPHPNQEGVPVVYTVHSLEEDTVFASGNHPLAGQTLHFDIEVVATRDASVEELAHGHVHGEGGCCGGQGEDHECCGGTGGENCCGGEGSKDGSCCSGEEGCC